MMWLTTLAALAAPCETALDAEELYVLDARSKDAVYDDDAAGHAAVMDELTERVACLESPIPQGPWARLLVNETLVRYAAQEEWNHVLATALAVDAGVGNIPDFLREAYVAPDIAEGAPVPDGVVLLVDGRPVDTVPAPRGLHVVQREFDGTWKSVFLRDAPVPDAFLVPPPPVERAGWATVGVFGGGSQWSQVVDPSSDFLADDSTAHSRFGLASHGHLPFAGPVGVGWSVTGTAQLFVADTLDEGEAVDAESKNLTLRPGGVGVLGPSFGDTLAVLVGGGVVVTRSHTRTADAVHLAALPWVEGRYRTGPLDTAVGLGWSPAAWSVVARGGWSTEGDIGLRFGVQAEALRMGGLGQQAEEGAPVLDDRDIDVSEVSVGLTAGVRFGRTD